VTGTTKTLRCMDIEAFDVDELSAIDGEIPCVRKTGASNPSSRTPGRTARIPTRVPAR
jgi:hypothetical protein